jgi:pimeloyl-ACP methyl ester carboxylesterase
MTAERFSIQIPEDVLIDLKYRLDHIRWPDQLENIAWERGTEKGYLQSLVSYWSEQYDWRAQEAELNRLPQFRSTVDGVDVHFIHERGRGPNPLPIILTHGWPDSFIRYKKMIPLLADPARYGGDPNDAFDVIVPSIPGFGFSGNPTVGGVNNSTVSELWAKLMTEELGYETFAAAGGDMGSGVTRYLAAIHPELLVGIHVTDIGIIRQLMTAHDEASLSKEELQYKADVQKWIVEEGGYISLQATKPQTLAYGLSDSPVGLAAWIVEKFRSWSDQDCEFDKKFGNDELLTNIMIYWITNTIGPSAHRYFENTHSLPQLGRIDVPTGVALFPSDVLLPPREWAEKNLNIMRWTHMPRGGHFAAMEEPELLAEDIRAFFRQFRTIKK